MTPICVYLADVIREEHNVEVGEDELVIKVSDLERRVGRLKKQVENMICTEEDIKKEFIDKIDNIFKLYYGK